MTQRIVDDFIPFDDMNRVTLALMYRAAGKQDKIISALEHAEHPFTKDVIRVLAGQRPRSKKYGKQARAYVKELIWWQFESQWCPTCSGRKVVGCINGWDKCPTCKGKGRVRKGKK